MSDEWRRCRARSSRRTANPCSDPSGLAGIPRLQAGEDVKISDQAHRLFAHIDQHRPSSERFDDLCADFDLDAQAVTDSQVILDVSATPLDEHVFRVVGTGSVTTSGRGVVAADGSAVALPPAMIALWAIASRKPNLAEAVSTTAEIAGCRREEVSEQFASVAEKMVAARVLDIGLGTRPARAN